MIDELHYGQWKKWINWLLAKPEDEKEILEEILKTSMPTEYAIVNRRTHRKYISEDKFVTKENFEKFLQRSKEAQEIMAKNKNANPTYKRIPKRIIKYTIVNAGRQAPSGKNRQAWHFVIIDDPKTTEMIGKFSSERSIEKFGPEYKEDKENMRKRFDYMKDERRIEIAMQSMADGTSQIGIKKAPYVISILGRLSDGVSPGHAPKQTFQECGGAAQNIDLRAYDLGLGTCRLLLPIDKPRHIAKIMEKIELDDPDWTIVELIAVGIPLFERAMHPPRRPLRKVCSYNKVDKGKLDYKH